MNSWDLKSIIGKKIETIRSLRYRDDPLYAQFILFDDGKTFIELEEQDYYSFHDCSTSAREIDVIVDGLQWNKIFNDKKHYPEATLIW